LNKIIQYTIAAIAICTASVLYIYAALFYRFAFNFETDINGQYFIVLIAGLGFTFILGLNIFRKENSKVQSACMIIVTVLLLLSAFSDKYSFANEYWTVVLAVFLLLACLLFLPARIIVAFPYFLVVIVLWQLWLAFEQMDGLKFEAGALTLQGSLQNSGVFCCYLVIHLPVLYYVTSQSISGWLKVICFLTIVAFIGFIICCSQSRSAIIGVLAAIISHCLFSYNQTLKTWLQRIPKWAIATGIGCLIFAAFFTAWYLFFLKKASAFGRVMKWDIAAQHIGDHFFTGTGIGRFSWYYPQWQVQYFSTNLNAPREYFFSSGESYIIFNEYLQLFETIGLIGFAGFALLLYWFFTVRSVEYVRLLSMTKATMIVLLVTGLTTYSFHINVFLILLAICFAVAAVISIKSSFIRRAVIIPILCFMLNVYTTFTIYQKWKAVVSWSTAIDDRIDVAFALWPPLNKTLNSDGKFLTEYGRWQVENGDPESAIATLEKARQYFISRVTMEALATAYEQAGNYPAAIEARRWLSNFMPNRFAPKYELLKLYKTMGDTSGVNEMINTILTMPVKIPSAEVDRIKDEVIKMHVHKP
jgi:hypothetical protein